jgi:hypothetical protein
MRQQRRLAIAASVALLAMLGVPTLAGADGIFKARLSGFEENPDISTGASGEFRAKLVDEDTIEYELSYENIEGGTATVAHIHLGKRGVNGGVIAFLCGGGGKPPCPATSGTVTGTIVAADVIGPAGQGIAPGEFDELVRAMRADATYVNVHSTPAFPGGEIRGQIRRGRGGGH